MELIYEQAVNMQSNLVQPNIHAQYVDIKKIEKQKTNVSPDKKQPERYELYFKILCFKRIHEEP